MKNTLIVIISTLLLALTIAPDLEASNLPRSREGTLIESTSPSEVMVRAKGIGYWEKGMTKKKDIEKTLLRTAEEDARKAAVYFVLFGGTDPLLSNESERKAFDPFMEDFFVPDNIRKFIAWEGEDFFSRVKKPIERKKKYELHIEKAYKVNKQLVQDYLNNIGILPSREAVTEVLGMPFIMVIPATKKGQNPIEVLQSNSDLSHAAKVIESYLTARQYDVVVPEQQVDLSALTLAQQSLKDVEEDYGYQLALSIGSDVYITYEANIEKDRLNTKKAIVNVRAYETTTARLLGTETGYSPSADIASKVLIENGINDAIDKVLSRIMAYWKDDMSRGVQYKLIVSISTDFDEDQAEEISFAFVDILENITKKGKFKENIVTDQTLDYLIWCDPQDYAQSSKLYRKIKKSFGDEFEDGTLKKVNINRKLVLLKVESD
ncbi:MAG: DUF6175 family protein [Candidatus Hatepunaea meridiana]|nr:DUF6175 family protein [Candidatus Hatepunaea meridiana]